MRLDRVRRDIGLLAESTNQPREQLKAFDASYSFPWYDAMSRVIAGGQPASALEETWKTMAEYYPSGARFARYDDNHDKDRAEVLFGERGNRVATVINFTIDGIPFIYNGQEIGDATPHDPYMHWAIRWAAGELPRQGAILRWYRDLCALRRSQPALTEGDTVWLETDAPASVVAFLRRRGDGEVLVVANLSNRRSRYSVQVKGIEGSRYHALFGRADDVVYKSNSITLADDVVYKSLSDSTLTLTLDSFGYYVAGRK